MSSAATPPVAACIIVWQRRRGGRAPCPARSSIAHEQRARRVRLCLDASRWRWRTACSGSRRSRTLFLNEDPLDNERLSAKTSTHFQELGRKSLVARAYAAFDIALWDLKAKAAGLPLHKLLGGAGRGCQLMPATSAGAG